MLFRQPRRKHLQTLLDRLVKTGKKVIVVAFGNPYLLQQIPVAPTYLVAWGGFPPRKLRQRARSSVFQPITGKLPISIPFAGGLRTIPRGTGIERRQVLEITNSILLTLQPCGGI